MKDKESIPVLFTRFPELKARIPWIDLGLRTTPVERLQGFGHENLWIKRDDLSSPLYGGNKIRKLEFILAEVLRQGKKHVVTCGGIGTNHGLATAIFCRTLGLRCTTLLFDQPLTANVKQNLRLLHAYGAEIVFGGTLLRTVLKQFVTRRFTQPFNYFLHPGGSSPLGTVGFVNAAFELKDQVEQGLIPEPTYLFCAVGSNGTMAGLLLGCLLAGLKTKVIGVRVSISHCGPFAVCTPKAVQKLAQRTYAYLKQRSPNLPMITLPLPTLLDDYLGAGYGHPTAKGREAYDLIKSKTGLVLDPCYTAKTFAAVVDFCQSHQNPDQTILFWNTYNSATITEPTDASQNREVPPNIKAILETDESISFPAPLNTITHA